MSTNPGAIIIQLILNNIADGDNQNVQDNLKQLPLGVVPKDYAETLLSWFLNQGAKYTNIEATRIVITAFDIMRIRVDPLPAITYMLSNPSLSRDVILHTMSCFPEKSPLDYYVDLVNMGDDMAALKIAGTLSVLFPALSNNDWNLLVSLTDNVEEEEYENQLLRSYFQSKSAETGACAECPKWVRKDIPKYDIQAAPEYIPSVKDAVDLIFDHMCSQKAVDRHIDPEREAEIKETLGSQYAISTIIEKIQMLNLAKDIPMFDDKHLFQEFGPVNTIYTHHPDLIDHDHECGKYGGCRMLLCKEFEQMTIDGEELDILAIDEHQYIQDWFRGSCDVCLKKIAHKHHALRQPLLHGGWHGCYCPGTCVEKNVEDQHTALMIGRMKEQLDVIGIRDR